MMDSGHSLDIAARADYLNHVAEPETPDTRVGGGVPTTPPPLTRAPRLSLPCRRPSMTGL